MKKKTSFAIAAYLAVVCLAFPAQAQYSSGIVNSDDINIRSDSNISSALIAKLSKGQRVEILLEKYDWYKIRLPRYAPAYVKKQFVEISQQHKAKINAKNVNIRLTPSDSAAIIGKSQKDESIEVMAESGQWYKIEPVINSFGWAHKQFITIAGPIKTPGQTTISVTSIIPQPQTGQPQTADIICEGILQLNANKHYPYKLVTQDYAIYLINPGTANNLEELTYQKIKIFAKSYPAPKEKYPVIEAIKAELRE